MRLLPTPEAKLATSGPDYARMGRDGAGGDDLTTTIWRLREASPDTRRVQRESGRITTPEQAKEGGHSVTIQDVAEHELAPVLCAKCGEPTNPTRADVFNGTWCDCDAELLPTPTVGNATGGNAQRGGARGDEKLLPGLARDHGTDWGPYTPAVERWERVLGRPAPAPVRYDGRGGKPRLNPELTEWMMGWPAGHVTDPQIGLTRPEQLKACGNGVVPMQAAAALREMLARPGVPPIREAA